MISAVAHVDAGRPPAMPGRRLSLTWMAANHDRVCRATLGRPGQLAPACGAR